MPLERKAPFSRDDDLLSEVFIDIALFEHTKQRTRKMNPKYKHYTVYRDKLDAILQELKVDGDLDEAVLRTERRYPLIQRQISRMDEKDAGAFRAHIRRYLAMHMADAPFELFVTERYVPPDPDAESELSELSDSDDGFRDHKYWTWEKPKSAVAKEETPPPQPPPPREGPLDLGVRAKEDFAVGDIIPRLHGKVHDLTDEQDDQLREQTLDFSVTLNAGRNCFQALFGPARFVNHDCNANVELTRRGGNMCFQVVREIHAGDEILSDYGESYFGYKNENCLCATCEENERGAYRQGEMIYEEPSLPSEGRVTRSLEVLFPVTRAERLEKERLARRRAQIAALRAAEAAAGRRKRDYEREFAMPAYLQQRTVNPTSRLSREERIRRRSEGVFSEPLPKKRRASAPEASKKPSAPSYLRLGVPTGGAAERSQRSLRRIGIELPSFERDSARSRGRKQSKEPVRSREQQIKDLESAIRASVLGENKSMDTDEPAIDSSPALPPKASPSRPAWPRPPRSRPSLPPSFKLPDSLSVASERGPRRRSGSTLAWLNGQKLSVEQEAMAIVLAAKTAAHGDAGYPHVRRKSSRGMDRRPSDPLHDLLPQRSLSSSSESSVADALIMKQPKTYSKRESLVSAAVSTAGNVIDDADGTTAASTVLLEPTKRRRRRSGAALAGVVLPVASPSWKTIKARSAFLSQQANDAARYSTREAVDSESESSTPISALWVDARDSSVTTTEDTKH